MASNWFDVRDYGATGDGSTDDTAAFDAAMQNAIANGGTIFVPRGTYKVGPLTNWDRGLTLRGDGRDFSILKSATGDHVLEITGISLANVTITDLGIVGPDSTPTDTGHGIYIHDNNFSVGLNFRNLAITGMPGNGFRSEGDIFNTVLDSVDVHDCGDHSIEMTSVGPGVTLINCFVHDVASGKAAYRLYSGHPTLIGCNGVTSGNAGGAWAIFGASTSDDGTTGYCLARLINCNVEDFTSNAPGITLRSGSYVVCSGVTFQALAGAYSFVAVSVPSGSWAQVDYDCSFVAGSGSWANSTPIHGDGTLMTYSSQAPSIYSDTVPLDVKTPYPLMFYGAGGQFYWSLSHLRAATDFMLGGTHNTVGTAAPTSGGAQGDKVWNTTPAAINDPIGWVCVSPGTWRPFGKVA